MLRKFHEAKNNNNSDVMLWGSGSPMREFLYVDDMAEAVVYALENMIFGKMGWSLLITFIRL